ncbi:MAG: FecR domain-containing protein [Clostridium sp.]|nr:FecR domain-containing protein [Clostridium sp.]
MGQKRDSRPGRRIFAGAMLMIIACMALSVLAGCGGRKHRRDRDDDEDKDVPSVFSEMIKNGAEEAEEDGEDSAGEAGKEDGEDSAGEAGKEDGDIFQGQNSPEEESLTSVQASTMRLVRQEGTVTLTDDGGKEQFIREQMLLDSGSGIATAQESLAGISLDDVKAVVLGEKSFALLSQYEKRLDLSLKEGEMYFSVAKPLEKDETYEIRTSTMVMGIRGTSGYVKAEEDGKDTVILTSGHAVLTAATGEEERIGPGQRIVAEAVPGGTSFTVSLVRPEDYPPLLLRELSADEAMMSEAAAQNPGSFREEMEKALQIVGGAGASGPDSPFAGGPLPTDENRIVMMGTIDTYYYADVIRLQGMPDPNPQYADPNRTYHLFVPDTPQRLTLNAVDGMRGGTLNLLKINDQAFTRSYDGHRVVISIDPAATWWPSDTSLPLGEPGTRDIRVLASE